MPSSLHQVSLLRLAKQQGVDEYKGQYLGLIGEFIDRHEYDNPAVVEDIPIVAIHADMGLHNIILSSQTPTEIRGTIDWQFVASAPYASLHRIIEMPFREPAPNQLGPEFDRANAHREAFWDAVPYWKQWNHSVAAQTFWEWFRFGLFMRPEPPPDDLPEDEKRSLWQENIRVVERMLSQYCPIKALESHKIAHTYFSLKRLTSPKHFIVLSLPEIFHCAYYDQGRD